MGVTAIPVKTEENRDGMGGYHGWSSIRKGEVVTIVPGEIAGGGVDPWQLVEYQGRRYWVSMVNLREIPESPGTLPGQEQSGDTR